MQETKDNSLFAELTPEESASVNGGYYYHRPHRRHHRDYYRYHGRDYDSPYYDGRRTYGYVASRRYGCYD
jgi:hypothetical protein